MATCKLKFWQNPSCEKTQKSSCDSNCYKAQKLKFLQNLKVNISTKFNLNCNIMHKLRLWQNSKVIWDKTQNSNCDNLNCNKTQELK